MSSTKKKDKQREREGERKRGREREKETERKEEGRICLNCLKNNNTISFGSGTSV